MGLPIPKLDDRTFAQLAEDGEKLISRYAPAWTDYNIHDPGITFIELLAWLTEMQQYFLDQVGEENYRKFLKLLGFRQREAIPAQAGVVFSLAPGEIFEEEGFFLPRGTKLAAEDIPFETEELLWFVPAAIRKVMGSLSTGIRDYTEANERGGLSYFPFGEEAEKGSRLYLGFDRAFPRNKRLSISFALFEDYRDAAGNKVERGAHGDEIPKVEVSARIQWEFCAGTEGGRLLWVSPEEMDDQTLNFTQSGRLFFRLPEDMERGLVPPCTEELFWFRATVQEGGYELAPRINTITLNAAGAIQRETLSEVISFSSDGSAGQSFYATTYLAFAGAILVQVQTPEGLWQHWTETKDFSHSNPEDQHFLFNKEDGAVLQFGDGVRGAIPAKGEDNVRLICFLPEWGDKSWLGRGTGLPNQKAVLDQIPVVCSTVLLQVGEPIRGETGPEMVWRDFVRVDDFDASGPGDAHFVLSSETGEILFGDGWQGIVPPAPADGEGQNIRALSYQSGGGAKGNVAAGGIHRIVGPQAGRPKFRVKNPLPGSGGEPAETLEETRGRALLDLKTPYRAVTDEDFEYLARSTPGLRVARAKSLPYGVEAGGSKGEDLPSVTVVVVPFSQAPKPEPSPGFLTTVCQHLDRHRLIGTQLRVIPPVYVTVGIQATILLKAGYDPPTSQQRLTEKINAFLDPLTGGPEGKGWPFGRTVYKSEIYEALEKVEGVNCVETLGLVALGGYDKDGNVSLPRHGLVFPGSHRIEVKTGETACGGKEGS